MGIIERLCLFVDFVPSFDVSLFLLLNVMVSLVVVLRHTEV